MKKLFSLALALVMMLALAANASAAKITIDPNVPVGGADTAETYTAYKIFDATFNGNDTSGNIAYTIDATSGFYETIRDFEVDGEPAFTLTAATGVNTGKYIVKVNSCYNDEAAAALSVELKAVIDAGKATPAGSDNAANADNKYEISVTDKGYYVIVSSLGSKMIVDTLGDIEIDTKNEYPTLTKTIVEGDSRIDATTADRGNTITFEIVVNIPATAVGAITVHDVLDEDMEYTGLIANAFATQNDSHCTDCTVDFTISDAVVAANKGGSVSFQYTATLNHDAELDTEHTNTAWLTYSAFTSVQDTVVVETFKVDVYKYTQAEENGPKTGLAGAGFVLKNAEGKYYKNTAGDVTWVDDIADATEYLTRAENDYSVAFEGLKNGTYTIIEKTVPTGYNPVAVDPTATVTNATPAVTEVLNQTGTELPSTGGVGTTIFYTVGGVMMAAAFVLFVTKKKMATEQ